MAEKCVVEGCNLEYDVICSFSFYNVNVGSDDENLRQEWIEGAMQESECLRRNVNLQLCGYHFELDSQGLWMDSPMLSELLTLHEQPPLIEPTAADKKAGRLPLPPQPLATPVSANATLVAGVAGAAPLSYQQLFESFISMEPKAAELIRTEHNYCAEPKKEEPANITRLNVRQLVDTLGYLSLKNLQRKQLWVVKVETDKSEATITQSEQVITKMSDPKQIIEIIPQTSAAVSEGDISQNEVYQIVDESELGDNFIYEIAEEQEITMDEVKEIPVSETNEWTVNIVPEESKPKYAYIKHYNTGKKKRHFTSEMNEITLPGDSDNYYILPDVDPSVGVEITTSYEPENYIVQEYENYVIEERPRKRREPKEFDPNKKKKKRRPSAGIREQVNQIQIKNELGSVQIKNELVEEQDWAMDNTIVYDQDVSDDYNDSKSNNPRVRRKNKKYLGYDFVT